MTIAITLLQELEREAPTTRRLLERVPDARLSWRPHEKARTLGALAMHVATVPGAVAELASTASPAQVPEFGEEPGTQRAVELVRTLDDSIATAQRVLSGMDDATLMATWRVVAGERELMVLPRAAFLRAIMLNHWYHHRGQLSVYLRFLGVPLPSIYGPSADENPFVCP
jgi:uncharacterized damage-inducible protein DinB